MFFWVFPWRQIVVGRRFGTLCQFHLQRPGVESANYNLTPGKHPKEHIQNRNISLLFPNHSARSQCAVYFMSKQLYTPKSKKYVLNLISGGSHGRCVFFGKSKMPLTPTAIPTADREAHSTHRLTIMSAH